MSEARKFSGSEWTLEDLLAIEQVCASHAKRYRLDTFPNQMEVISSEQMLDGYVSGGLPVNYAHWSFGKHFLIENAKYRTGANSLAYEIVINTNPCIAFLMEDNSLAMQALVIPHACFGHNSFSKGNYLFRQWTQPDAILDYMLFARNYIADCEEHYGVDRVEQTLDALHALRDQGLDKYKRPSKLDSRKERAEQAKRLFAAQETMRQAEYYSVVPHATKAAAADSSYPVNPEENLLYFIEKHAPKLEPWQRELARIVRKIAQYFYPQRQTQVMNEGWATFWHHRLINDMYDAGEIDQGILLECLHSHTNVIRQREYSPLNPYALGFAAWNEIKRVCDKPTAEDREYLPEIAGKDWLETFHGIMQDYRDESFLLQFLTPKLVRDFKLMNVKTEEGLDHWAVSDTAGPEGFKSIRSQLSASYRLESAMPEISVIRYARDTDRRLILHHHSYRGKRLVKAQAEQTLKHLRSLWGFGVSLETVDQDGRTIETY
ncbi:MAG TPA: SpoVR family protein [Steroidobacteraceae bacterium]|nr:SpoVR family protein [Steroidobacteraceae bacterium]